MACIYNVKPRKGSQITNETDNIDPKEKKKRKEKNNKLLQYIFRWNFSVQNFYF